MFKQIGITLLEIFDHEIIFELFPNFQLEVMLSKKWYSSYAPVNNSILVSILNEIELRPGTFTEVYKTSVA